MPGLTPYQTIGPFFHFSLVTPSSATLAQPTSTGRHISIEGLVLDGAGQPVSDALVEIWQANADGRYTHPEDRREAPLDPSFSGFGRSPTDSEGRFAFTTVMPGRVPGPDDSWQAPHLVVGVFARGLLTRLVTRMYFGDDPFHQEDPILALIPLPRRPTLIAEALTPDRYQFNIVLQGRNETVFFDV